MDEKKNGNIFKNNKYSVSTCFDKNYNILIKYCKSLNLKKDVKNQNEH